jgi:hypothetical protein
MTLLPFDIDCHRSAQTTRQTCTQNLQCSMDHLGSLAARPFRWNSCTRLPLRKIALLCETVWHSWLTNHQTCSRN